MGIVSYNDHKVKVKDSIYGETLQQKRSLVSEAPKYLRLGFFNPTKNSFLVDGFALPVVSSPD